MTMHPDEAQLRLLAEGLASYVPAVSAVLAFRELVEARCRRVVENRLEDYGGALGTSLDRNQLVGCQYPKLSQWDGTFASLGVDLRDLGDARAWLSHLLYLEQGENGQWVAQVGACLWVRKSQQMTRVRKAVRPQPPNLSFEEANHEVWLYEPISSSEMQDFEKKLDNVLVQWITLWKRAGGLRVLSAS
jgi:hypothetical protein